MIKVLLLAQGDSANTAHWADSLRRFGPATVEVWSMPSLPSGLRLLLLPVFAWMIRRKVRRFKPDVVIGYRVTSYGFLAALSGFRPFVVAAQGETDVWPPGHWSNALTSRMAHYALRRAALIHAWGQSMVPSLLELGADADRVLVMPRGIDLEQFAGHKPFSGNTFTCLVSRSLFPEYHHEVIIAAFAELAHRLPGVSFRLVIAGDGPLRAALVAQCVRLHLDQTVEFTGKIDAQQLAQKLGQTDVYISLPETEGVSASLLEAMAAGCIPVVTDLPSNREWIRHGVNGALVARSTREVSDALAAIWEDRLRYQEAARSNREMVSQRADARSNAVTFVRKYQNLPR